MIISLATIDFSGVSSGPSAKLQEKTATILLTDTTTEILPDTGYDGMSKVSVSHAPVQETAEQTITENGSHRITPSEGYDAMFQCVVDVNVQSGGEIDFSSIGYSPEMTKETNDIINSDIAYSEQLLAEYDDTKKYSYDKKLVYAPLFPTQNRTSFLEMFDNCANLEIVPSLDTANGTSFNSMFNRCSVLQSVQLFNTSNGTDFYRMFEGYNRLQTIPAFNTSKGTVFSRMFRSCSVLTTIPPLDTSKGTSFEFMFSGCNKLQTVPPLDTSKGTSFNYMFERCNDLRTISSLNLSKGYDFSSMFSQCVNLTDITLVGSISATIDFSSCSELLYNSIKSILTACSNTTTTNAKRVSFKSTIQDQNNELTNLVATCTSKGWTVSGLTLQ